MPCTCGICGVEHKNKGLNVPEDTILPPKRQFKTPQSAAPGHTLTAHREAAYWREQYENLRREYEDLEDTYRNLAGRHVTLRKELGI
jgi:hypothetical protein